jgi:hypothetical protein
MLAQYLQQICQELSIEEKPELNSEGYYVVSIDDSLNIRFKENQDTTIFLQSLCAPIPKQDAESFFTLIMKAHLFGKETGKSFFGIDGKEENLLISQLLPPRVGYDGFRSELEDYVNQVEFWRDESSVFGQKNNENDKKAS